jgi:mycothiol synthase
VTVTPPVGVSLQTRGRLSPAEVEQVRALVGAAADADGVSPLSEHVLLHLRHGGDEPGRNLLARAADRLVGYAHVDTTDRVEGASAELVVHPDARGRGIGRTLGEAAVAASPDGRLRLWAHGEHPAAAHLAAAMGFRRARVLWQMRRSLIAPLPVVALPKGVTVRTFRPGRDEDAWLRVNTRAFAGHPEQGSWTRRALDARMLEPWFDPAGFFLAERDEEIVGFHWTKVHGGAAAEGQQPHGHEPIGEVYVVGVDPSAQGTGLGPALTVVGLRYLRDRGLGQVMLYVDEANTNAIKVYERLGFVYWDSDVSYRRDGDAWGSQGDSLVT